MNVVIILSVSYLRSRKRINLVKTSIEYTGAIQNPRHSSLIFGGSECSTDENNSHIKKRMFDFRFATPNRTTRPLSKYNLVFLLKNPYSFLICRFRR